jgi:hypothetical protein
MARDKYHFQFRKALEKEGWLITHDSYDFSIGSVDFEIDLGAEMMLGAEKDGKIIAIEIKSFLEDSPVSAFHKAVGQFDNYFLGLSLHDPNRILYLAIPDAIFNTFFQRPFIKLVVQKKAIKIITYDAHKEVIVQWID